MFEQGSSFVDDAGKFLQPFPIVALRSNKYSVLTGNPPRPEACYDCDTFNLITASHFVRDRRKKNPN